MKVAIVHDWLTIYGGSESIIRILHEMFPQAPIYTSVYDRDNMPDDFKGMDIRTSFIQNMPMAKKKYTSYLPLMPRAFEQFDLSEYDLVISSSTCCAKGVITGANTLHICYCNTPMRYGWDFYFQYRNGKSALARPVINTIMHSVRMWDRLSADRVDLFIANSYNVARRIKKHYRRKSTVIYPPVRTDMFQESRKSEDFYLIVSRFVPYKRVDLVVEAFSKLGLPLVVIGDGSEYEKIAAKAGPNVKLLGRLSDEKVLDYMSRCKAFLFPGEEDFGITPIEAQSCGKPVIAYGRGGALETVVENETGVFFYEQTLSAVADAVRRFEKIKFDADKIHKHAEKFSEERFRRELKDYIYSRYKQFDEMRRHPQKSQRGDKA